MSRPDLHPSAEPNPENSHRVPAAPRGPAALHHTRHGATSFWTAALLQHPSHQFLHQPTPRASARQSALRVAARADPESARPAVARALRGVPGRGDEQPPPPAPGPRSLTVALGSIGHAEEQGGIAAELREKDGQRRQGRPSPRGVSAHRARGGGMRWAE